MTEHPKAPVRAVFFDIDGTLISYRTHTMPPSTLRALQALHDKGIKVVLASGRPLFLMASILELFPFDAIAALNGQVCYVDGQVIRKQTFDREDMRRLAAHAEECGYPCLIMEENSSFLTGVNDAVREHYRIIDEDMTQLGETAWITERDVYQFVVYADARDETALVEMLSGAEAIRAAPMCLDFIPSTGGKPMGMQAIADHFGIPMEATMAFGDGMNDTSMLQAAGIGVAMGNAEDAVKDAADYVTGDVDEDGVWDALRRLAVI